MDKPPKPSVGNAKRHVDHVAYYHTYKYNSLQRLNKSKSMHGVKRVIAFCILTAVLPASLIILPLYLRHTVFADVVYPIAESDIIEIRDGISSVFCQRHSLQMNSSFNAFQLNQKPEISQIRKHIRLKKSMVLPDDTLEYWGFYLLKGATVALKVCSRYDGSRILVVKGERNLRTCGLLEHNKNKFGPHFNSEHGQVLVTFESAAEIVDSSRSNKNNSGYYTSPDLGNHGGEDLTDEDMATSETAVPVPAKHSKYGSVLKNTLNSRQHKTTTEATTRTTIAGDNKVRKRHRGGPPKPEKTVVDGPEREDEVQQQRRRRHHGKHGHRDKISQPIGEVTGLSEAERTRAKRDTIYDRKINHGGNAMNNSNNTSDSVSSFENSLLTCYDGDILLAKSFPPSHLCQDVQYLESGLHMVTKHEIASDGYYYYIFYSDNDYVQNDIHAVFDIYKPTYQYANISESKGCINSTNCSFPIAFWSDERVIVEVPTRDGIEHEEDDITLLISTCQPRMAIYIIFPISVLFLVLTCAFL
ncbi:uncharacterized protein LOC6032434 isoform X1 [Culex quinquefasciatus]|uniref:E3 ubiquitin-protein ligase APD1-4 middle domain-containing protein n=2 Tax=Culex quinquefasciatus TaxID=7176 RepID=A0A1S4J3I1_CULQU|nr:uncharacterized protein LOC6032434 isoform X1 [Culex quinquefasciatus]